METISKERLHRIRIQDDISVTIRPSSIIITFLREYWWGLRSTRDCHGRRVVNVVSFF
jgi:hypothetical protein